MNKAQSPVSYQAVEWKGDFVKLLDQTLLPAEEIYEEITDYHQMMTAIKELNEVAIEISGTRPTARNLFWAIDRMENVAAKGKNVEDIKTALLKEAKKIHAEEAEATFDLSKNGAE